MALAVWGLMKSMNRHMNRVEFMEAPDPKADSGDTAEATGAAKPQQG